MENVLIRPANSDDCEAIVSLIAQGELNTHREDPTLPLADSYLQMFHEIQADKNQLLCVAQLQKQVVGTFQMTFIPYLSHQGKRVAQLESVHVLQSFRGKQIGTAMMKWAIDKAKEVGCHRLQLTSSKQRKDAHRFYERLGFVASHKGMKLFL